MFDSSDFFITADVGSSHGQSRPHDVVRIRRALNETGHGRSPDNPSTRYDKSIHDNIIEFQDDFGLEQDGWLRSGDPTETALQLALDARRDGGDAGMEAFREPFAAFNRDGFQFLPDRSRSSDRTHGWIGPDGNELTDAERDSLLVGKQRGNQFKRLPFNDPAVAFDRPNPIAPLARNVFGQHAVAAPPGTDWYAQPAASKTEPEPESLQMSTESATPVAAPDPTQIVRTTPAPQAGAHPSAPPASPSKPIMAIPSYRKKVIGDQGNAWRDWSASVKQLPSVSATEERAYMEIFAAEGGNQPDRSSSAMSGILQGTLNELLAKGFVKGVKPGVTPKQLPIQKRVEVYRGYLDFALKDAGGSAALRQIDNPEAAAALADTLFMHGRGGGGRLIQNAVNDIIPKRVQADGVVGIKTIEAYKSLVADPNQHQMLLDALARQRRDTVKNDPDFKGKEIRINHFRFQKSP